MTWFAGIVTAAALVAAMVVQRRQRAVQPAGRGVLGLATRLAIGPSNRDTIGLVTLAGIVLAAPAAVGLVWLTAQAAGITGLDAAAWAPAGVDTVVLLVVVAAGLDLGLVGLWHGVAVLEFLKRTVVGRRWPGLLGPAKRHAVIGLLLPALIVAIWPLLMQTTSDAANAVGGVPAPAACAPADLAGDAVAGFGPDRLANAQVINQVGLELGVPERGRWIALATAMQESGLRNIDWGDRDSVGLFQQRPSQGWGTVAQILDPRYAATQFYNRLLKLLNWQNLPLWQAAQAVQRSGFPTAYTKWEAAAAAVLGAVTNTTCSGRS